MTYNPGDVVAVKCVARTLHVDGTIAISRGALSTIWVYEQSENVAPGTPPEELEALQAVADAAREFIAHPNANNFEDQREALARLEAAKEAQR